METPRPDGPEAIHSDDPRSIRGRSFAGMIVCQALGAFNDNMFRWLIVGIGQYHVAQQQEAVILSAGLACLVAPFLLFAAPAGYCADRFSKRTVIVAAKVAELVIMAAGGLVVCFGQILSSVTGIELFGIYALFVILFFMGAQSAIFSPSKYGSIPELVKPGEISKANGVLQLTTMIAIILGTVAGTTLYSISEPAGAALVVQPGDRPELIHLWIHPLALMGVSLLGIAASLLIRPLPAANPSRKFPWNMTLHAWRDLRHLASNSALFRAALGAAFFWTLASLYQMNVERFYDELYKNPEFLRWLEEHGVSRQVFHLGALLAVLSLGVGVGSVLAGIWSAGHVELGIVPVGASGVVVVALLLAATPDPFVLGPITTYTMNLALLFFLGVAAGLFVVPLEAFLQHRSDIHLRGSILAANNFMTFAGMLAISGIYPLLYSRLGLSARQIFFLSAAVTVPVVLYAFLQLTQATVRFVVWLATRALYRVHITGEENLPNTGGALLVSNHVSWMDGCLIYTLSKRQIRMMAYEPFTRLFWTRWLSQRTGIIPIMTTPKSVKRAIETVREALRHGDLVAMFPEGGISRTGQLMPFKPGMMLMLQGTGAPVIPIYLSGMWGSIFSFEGGKFFWKWPTRWRRRVSITIGAPLQGAISIHDVRRAIETMEIKAMAHEPSPMPLTQAFLRECRRSRRRSKAADSLGAELSGGELLLRTLVVRQCLRREILAPDEKFVGLFLPPSVPAVVTNAALSLDHRVAVNVNYTLSEAVANECVQRCGIRHVITSRKFMERVGMKLRANLVFLEDLPGCIAFTDKLVGFIQARLLPLRMLESVLGVRKTQPTDLLTVIFTSGSTGTPKGVMLSHGNVASNVQAMNQIVKLSTDDVLIGVLPFFHSYGYTATMWTVLALPPKGVYHFSPLDAHQVGKLCHDHRATVLMSTPTFLRHYLRRCPKEQFAALEVVFASAEKLPRELSDAFEEKFGVRPSEAYGATELSPLVSVNIPASRSPVSGVATSREGSVGRPIPGVVVKVVHPETGEQLGFGQPGMLWVTGPNVMQGYLRQPEETAKVIRDGWYITGDIGFIDEDGFIHITGRESRFSKIGGEMVPHIRIEETIAQILGDEEQLHAAVTAVPDERKGERLVVLHTELPMSVDALREQLTQRGLPNIWIPSPDSFLLVPEIPVLGTGKLDLKAIKELALSRLASAEVGR